MFLGEKNVYINNYFAYVCSYEKASFIGAYRKLQELHLTKKPAI